MKKEEEEEEALKARRKVPCATTVSPHPLYCTHFSSDYGGQSGNGIATHTRAPTHTHRHPRRHG